jgi:tRNA-uridine 2-sulfurtransferase
VSSWEDARRVSARIVVGMSGGVDSSVAAGLLVEAGHEAIGVTLRVWPWAEPTDAVRRFGSCCSVETADDARRVAQRLGIPYYLLNTEEAFSRNVIDRFVQDYRAGRTPVPCVACNRDLKFGSLLRRALAWDAGAVATGHYARITRDPVMGRSLLWKAVDARKDQSDFLWPLTQDQLAAARFPVGHLTKDEVREHARRLGLVTADKPESQELCFIPDDDYRGFLKRRDPSAFRPGRIVDIDGVERGQHGGIVNFTIGQRRGLGLHGGAVKYVVDLDPETHTVVVGDGADLERDSLVATDVNFIAGEAPRTPMRVEARIRHRHEPAPASLRMLDNGHVEVSFDRPQRAITPGQSVVWYQGDLVIGGGVIARARVDSPQVA